MKADELGVSKFLMRGDNCFDLGSNSRYGEKQMDLRRFRDKPGGIGLVCGKEGLDMNMGQLRLKE